MIDDLLRQTCNGDLAELLASIIQYTQDGIITIDDTQAVVMYNNGAMNMFEYSPDEVLGNDLTMLLPKRSRDIHHKHVKAFNASTGNGGDDSSIPASERKDLSGIRKSGEEFPCEVSISKTIFKGKTYFTAVIRDISERCYREKLLQDKNQELAAYKAELLNQINEVAHKI